MIQESPSSKGTRTIGRQTKLRKPLPVHAERQHTPVRKQPQIQSTRTMPPTPQSGIQKHLAAGGILYRNPSLTEVWARRSSALKSGKKMSEYVSRSLWIRAAPTSMLLTLLPALLLENLRMRAKLRTNSSSTQSFLGGSPLLMLPFNSSVSFVPDDRRD